MRQNDKNATQKVELQKMKTACSLAYQKYGNGVPLTQTREKALGYVANRLLLLIVRALRDRDPLSLNFLKLLILIIC